MTVGVVGLGKLGLPYALTLAAAGEHVLVWDHDPDVRRAVANCVSHIDEPGVQHLLDTVRLEVMLYPDAMAKRAHTIFIVVPTDSLPDGSFDDSYVVDAIKSLNVKRPLTVAIVSTVSPGTLTKSLLPLVKNLGVGAELVYVPTLIALGSVIHDLEQPDVQIVGCDAKVGTTTVTSTVAADTVKRVLAKVAPNAQVSVMDYESAAIAKLASNVFVTLKIGFANVIAQLCDQHNAHVQSVTTAIGFNRRIGHRALRPGAGFGGPCFPRDAAAFAAAGATLGANVLALNENHLSYVTWQVIRHVTALCCGDRQATTFAVVGRAYKSGTNYTIESFGDRLVDSLSGRGLRHVDVREADVVVMALPERAVDLCKHVKHGALVYDLWGTHSYVTTQCPSVSYVQLGAPRLNYYAKDNQ